MAVEAFLDGRIPWVGIADVVAETLDAMGATTTSTQVDDVLAADAEAAPAGPARPLARRLAD